MACAWAFWLTGPNLHSPGARLHADRRSDPSQGQRTSTEPSAIQRPFCRTEVSFLSVASYLLEAHDSQMCHKGATPDRGKSPQGVVSSSCAYARVCQLPFFLVLPSQKRVREFSARHHLAAYPPRGTERCFPSRCGH